MTDQSSDVTQLKTLVTRPQTGAATLDREQTELLKRTVCEGATNDEFLMFVGICRRTGLDPFAKQIYFRKYNTKNGPRVTVITGIDGYRLMAQRTGEYEGQVGPMWCGPDGTWKDVWLESKPPAACRIGVWRTKFREPAFAIAKWSEYYPSNEKDRFIWDKMPANQLAKCAEALALRKSFPHELSGLYVREEMDQAESVPAGKSTAISVTTVATGPAGSAASDTRKKFSRADTITHDGDMASHAQVAYLHQLKHKVGGLSDDLYRKQLAAYKDIEGKPIDSSVKLSKAQISHLIDRYEARIAQQEARASEQPDLEAAFSRAEENARLREVIGPEENH